MIETLISLVKEALARHDMPDEWEERAVKVLALAKSQPGKESLIHDPDFCHDPVCPKCYTVKETSGYITGGHTTLEFEPEQSEVNELNGVLFDLWRNGHIRCDAHNQSCAVNGKEVATAILKAGYRKEIK